MWSGNIHLYCVRTLHFRCSFFSDIYFLQFSHIIFRATSSYTRCDNLSVFDSHVYVCIELPGGRETALYLHFVWQFFSPSISIWHWALFVVYSYHRLSLNLHICVDLSPVFINFMPLIQTHFLYWNAVCHPTFESLLILSYIALQKSSANSHSYSYITRSRLFKSIFISSTCSLHTRPLLGKSMTNGAPLLYIFYFLLTTWTSTLHRAP